MWVFTNRRTSIGTIKYNRKVFINNFLFSFSNNNRGKRTPFMSQI